jgi:hypothetical protein
MRGGLHKATSVNLGAGCKMLQLKLRVHRSLKFASGNNLKIKGVGNPDTWRDGSFMRRQTIYILRVATHAQTVKHPRGANGLPTYRKGVLLRQALPFSSRCNIVITHASIGACQLGSLFRGGGKALRFVSLALVSTTIILSACAAPMRMREIEAVSAN